MNLTDNNIRDVIKWCKGEMEDPEFYLNLPASDWMIYGTTDAQKKYLITESVIVDLMQAHVDFNEVSIKNVKEMIIAKLKGIDKTSYKEVSNYWLKRIGSIPTDAKKGNELLRLQGKNQKTTKEGKIISKYGRHIKEIGYGDPEKARASFVKRFLCSPRFSLVRDWDREDELVNMVENNAPSLKAPERTESGKNRSFDSVMADLTVRRMCKFLIYDSINRGGCIAYLLDDIDLDRVAYMVQPDRSIPDVARIGDDKKVPICTSEIREIFRCWDKLRDKVFFYKAFIRCAPPWDSSVGSPNNIESWAHYACHRAQKILNSSGIKMAPATQDKLEKVLNNYKDGDCLGAIKIFHESRPSYLDGRRFLNSTIAGREVKSFKRN